MTSPARKHLILLGTHDDYIHAVQFDPATLTLTKTSELKTSPHPSWLTPHPTIPDIIYANGHVEGKAFALRVLNDQGSLQIISEAVTDGTGPTHLAVLDDGSGVLFAHVSNAKTRTIILTSSSHTYLAPTPADYASPQYGSGNVTLIPLSSDGTFASPSPTFSLPGAYSPIPHPRQESAHAHQIVLHGEELLVPDLGSNKVWRLREQGGRLEAVGIVEGFEVGDGPRHCVVHPSGERRVSTMFGPRRSWLGKDSSSDFAAVANEVLGKYVYTLLELSSYVTVHRISPTPSAPSELIARLSMLPTHDEPVRPKLGASEILLLPPLHPGGPSLLIASNRDSPSAEGDALALYAVSPDGGDVKPTKEAFVRGVGRHLRGVAADPSGRWVMVCGRDEGGVKLFERVGEDGLELKEVAKIDIPNTVCPLWMS
ncbi:hypothetical protein JCM24511_08887 [Saitozyma sp. JCM 24511]|nr:hypothetical protein JCM24511_08887 [Saitozyma sp. JCM 24511]